MAGNYPFKILITADTLGGVWTYSLELIKALEPYYVEVSLATMGAPLNSQQHQDLASLSNVKLYESSYKLEWMENPWDDVNKAGEWLLKLNKKINPDLIHLNNFAHGHLPWGKPVLVVAHSCVLSWWEAVKGEEAPPNWDTYRKCIAKGLHGADIVVAPSKDMLRSVERLYGPFLNKRVIYNGRNPFLFQSGEKEEFIFSMGRIWDEAKNISLLTSIASQIPWPIYLAGENKPPANGKAMNPKNVIFLGQLSQPKVCEWLSKASIYVLPVKYEPFGLSLLEAAMSRCAIVAGKTESLVEIWKDAATFVDQQDPEALLSAILNLIENGLFRKIIAGEVYNRSLRYTSHRMGAEYFETYMNLLMRNNTFYSTKKELILGL
ncbi:MAG TPA: glycosyltransferase family 4 protein [Cytophagaceae bacterium]|jgi:glycosyltransferase involved in cell wall biosynthesis